jgi:hypothetical protein
MKKKYLYMAVTNDELELPLVVEERLKDLAIKLNRNYEGLKGAFYQKSISKDKTYKCVKVEI